MQNYVLDLWNEWKHERGNWRKFGSALCLLILQFEDDEPEENQQFNSITDDFVEFCLSPHISTPSPPPFLFLALACSLPPPFPSRLSCSRFHFAPASPPLPFVAHSVVALLVISSCYGTPLVTSSILCTVADECREDLQMLAAALYGLVTGASSLEVSSFCFAFVPTWRCRFVSTVLKAVLAHRTLCCSSCSPSTCARWWIPP